MDLRPSQTFVIGKAALTRCRGGFYEFTNAHGAVRQMAGNAFMEELFEAANLGTGADAPPTGRVDR